MQSVTYYNYHPRNGRHVDCSSQGSKGSHKVSNAENKPPKITVKNGLGEGN